MASCTHKDHIHFVEPPEDIAGCEECLKSGDRWVHLRMCQSAARSAAATLAEPARERARAREAHPVLRSVEPGEDWSWCVIDEVAFVVRRT